ncbi:E3 ubiquitin-protein ligase ATL6-like [Rutidosis leptorrhynchoides]|uniref:E3 ubiquitin-protein ligase ATL6-like n=1 Tax=Rutidosis leptorrhynchoides TaxID=125765 RepID=UPI003A9A0FDF
MNISFIHNIFMYLLLILLLLFVPRTSPQSIRAGTSPAYPYDFGGNVSPPVKIILAFLIFGMFLIAFLALYLRKCLETSSSVETNGSIPIVNNHLSRLKFGLDRSLLESFPVFRYSDVKNLKIGKGTLECAVCISEFADNERLRFLPKCLHVFHPDCIDAWLASHVTCPVCRADLTKGKLEFNHELTQVQVENSRNGNRNRTDSEIVEVEEVSEDFKLRRSHSTGHSLVSPGENCERYTLRLPEDVRKQIVTLKRAKSCGFGVDGNSRRGVRRWTPDRICGGSDLWNDTVTKMPGFIGRTGSVGKSDPGQSSVSVPV